MQLKHAPGRLTTASILQRPDRRFAQLPEWSKSVIAMLGSPHWRGIQLYIMGDIDESLCHSLCFAALTMPALAATDVVVNVPMAFPESLTSTPNGTLYIGSMNLGAVYRALPGQKTATTWISKTGRQFRHACWVCWPMRRPARFMSATTMATTPISRPSRSRPRG